MNVGKGDVSHSSQNSEVIEVNKNGSKDELVTSHDEKKNPSTYCDDSKEQDLINPQIVGRQVLRSDGVYVKGQVQGYGVNFTVDTGAARTVLSKQAFQQIPKSKRPILKSSNMLASADGKPLDELGKAMFNVKLKELDFNIELVVANIEDEALLGLDILMKADCGPANLRLSDGIMLLGGASIPCKQIGLPEKVRKVRVADNFTIPPRSEMLIYVFIDRLEIDQSSQSQDFVLESNADILQKFPIIMAPTIVNLEKDVTCIVRVMNPFDQQFELHQDTVIGEAEKLITETKVLVECEDKEEITNFSSVRRIKLADAQPVQWETSTGIIRNITKKGTADGGKSGIVPDHLHGMYIDAIKGRSENECADIARLLTQFSNEFSTNETDLGLTQLTEHSIDTGDAKPVRQPPSRVPMAFANDEKK